MPIKARPFGCQEKFDWGADIRDVNARPNAVLLLSERSLDFNPPDLAFGIAA